LIIARGHLQLSAKAKALTTVEYTDDGLTFHAFPDLPYCKPGQFMTVLEGGNIFVGGGSQSKSCFLYKNKGNRFTKSFKDFLRGQKSEHGTWKKCPDMTTEREGARDGVHQIFQDFIRTTIPVSTARLFSVLQNINDS
jgi:hypothetical protein